MSITPWEKKVLKARGAAERVAEIEDELRLAVGLTALREQAGLSSASRSTDSVCLSRASLPSNVRRISPDLNPDEPTTPTGSSPPHANVPNGPTPAVEALATITAPVTVARLAKLAGVSRSWIYTQPKLIAEIETLAATPPTAATEPSERAPRRCNGVSNSPTKRVPRHSLLCQAASARRAC